MLIIKLTEISKNGIVKTWQQVIKDGTIKDLSDLVRIALNAEDDYMDAEESWR
tara:strand:+ start:59 stop:217 length:159 start_codon:yes stop_codon:yes gene_type:complete